MQPQSQSDDENIIDTLRPAVGRLTPAGLRKLLAVVAGDCLKTSGDESPVTIEDGRVFAFVSSAQKANFDLALRFSPEEQVAIERNAFDPRFSKPWREVLAQLDAADDRQ